MVGNRGTNEPNQRGLLSGDFAKSSIDLNQRISSAKVVAHFVRNASALWVARFNCSNVSVAKTNVIVTLLAQYLKIT